MATLEDRFYERTIPEYGASPELGVLPREEWKWGHAAPAPTATVTVLVSVDPDSGYSTMTDMQGRVMSRFLMPEGLRRGFRLVRARQRDALHDHIMQTCAGVRRRQIRRRK
jgi:hypothetical protein